MAVTPDKQSAGQIRMALKQIVAEYGPEVLSKPSVMSNLLKDLLPDAPRIARLFVAAAEDQVADVVRFHVAGGLDHATAVRLAASAFAAATMFAPDACMWATSELAIALGALTEDAVLSAGEVADIAGAPPDLANDASFQHQNASAGSSAQLATPTRTEKVSVPQWQVTTASAAAVVREQGTGQGDHDSRVPVRTASLTGLPYLSTMALSPDRSTMAGIAFRALPARAPGEDGQNVHEVVLWDIADLRRPAQVALLPYREASLRAMAYLPGGQVIATAASKMKGGIPADGADLTLWRITEPSRPSVASKFVSTGTGHSIRFSQDGQTMATAGPNLTLWDIGKAVGSRWSRPKPSLVIKAADHRLPIDMVGFAPNARLIAVSTTESELINPAPRRRGKDSAYWQTQSHVSLWDISQAIPTRISGMDSVFSGRISEILFLSNDQLLIITDSAVDLWDISDLAYPPRLAASFGGKEIGQIVAFAAERRVVATALAGVVSLWDIKDIANPASLGRLTGHFPPTPFALSQDGRTLVTPGGVAGSLILWDLGQMP